MKLPTTSDRYPSPYCDACAGRTATVSEDAPRSIVGSEGRSKCGRATLTARVQRDRPGLYYSLSPEGDVGRGLACLAGCPRFCLMDLDRRGGEMGAEEQIAEALRPAVQAAGLEIWDVERSGATVRVLVERPGGIDLDSISQLSSAISATLDEHDELVPAGKYTARGIEPRAGAPAALPGALRPVYRPRSDR